jgi:hypothetical protein
MMLTLQMLGVVMNLQQHGIHLLQVMAEAHHLFQNLRPLKDVFLLLLGALAAQVLLTHSVSNC